MNASNSCVDDFSFPFGDRVNPPSTRGGLVSVLDHLVAGIVGKQKPQFDLWGDTFNTAARMTRYGEPGVVVMTAATSRLIQDRFKLNRLGIFEVKGKGMVEIVTCC